MDSNTHSIRPADPLPALTAAVDGLAAQELHGLPDAVRAERVLQLRRLLDRLEGHWLNELAAVDAGGAAGAEEDVQAGSTAGWAPQPPADGRGCGQQPTTGRRPHRTGPPHPGGRPAAPEWRGPAQLTVTVDLDSLVGGPGTLGGDTDSGPLDPEACRRLACDGALTRVLVTRHPSDPHSHEIPADHEVPSGHDVPSSHPGHDGLDSDENLTARLRTAAALLPPVLGGAPTQPLEVGRTSRVVTPTQRVALAVRDHGCVFPGCARPLAWCDAHRLRHWLHGGPTDLANLALVCRAHHRAVHEGAGGWPGPPTGRLTTT